MIDPFTICLSVGVAALLIDRLYKWAKKINESKCCGVEVVRNSVDVQNTNTNINNVYVPSIDPKH